MQPAHRPLLDQRLLATPIPAAPITVLAGAVNRTDGLVLHAGFQSLGAISPSGRSQPFSSHGAPVDVTTERGRRIVCPQAPRRCGRSPATAFWASFAALDCRTTAGPAAFSLRRQRGRSLPCQRACPFRPDNGRHFICRVSRNRDIAGRCRRIAQYGRVYGAHQKDRISAVKSNIGHLLTASGVPALIKVLGNWRTASCAPLLIEIILTPALQGIRIRSGALQRAMGRNRYRPTLRGN